MRSRWLSHPAVLAMKIECIEVEFHLEGCDSLKEKRARFHGMRERIGKRQGVAVAESAHQDSLRLAGWTFVVLAQNQQLVDQIWAEIEADLLRIDAPIVRVERQRL